MTLHPANGSQRVSAGRAGLATTHSGASDVPHRDPTKPATPRRHPDGTHPAGDRDPAPWHRLRWPDRRRDDDLDEDDEFGAHASLPEWPWDEPL